MLGLLLQIEPKLTEELVVSWTGWKSFEGEVQIRTEVPTKRGKFIDLEIRQETPSRRVVWIEIKRDLPGESSEGQVQGYLEELFELCGEAGRGYVVYLPRPGVLDPKPAERETVGYKYSDWTEFGNWLDEEAKTRGSLAEDFIQFLREEQLYVTGLDVAGLEQLDNRVPDRFVKLIQQARDRIEREVRELGVDVSQGVFRPSDPRKWVVGWGKEATWAHFPLPEGVPGYGQIKLEWNLRERKSGDHRGEVVFGAGLTWLGESGDPWFGHAEALDAALRAQGGTQFQPYEDDRLRFFGWLSPEGIVTGANDFDGQVEILARFVVASFHDCISALSEFDGQMPTDGSEAI